MVIKIQLEAVKIAICTRKSWKQSIILYEMSNGWVRSRYTYGNRVQDAGAGR